MMAFPHWHYFWAGKDRWAWHRIRLWLPYEEEVCTSPLGVGLLAPLPHSGHWESTVPGWGSGRSGLPERSPNKERYPNFPPIAVLPNPKAFWDGASNSSDNSSKTCPGSREGQAWGTGEVGRSRESTEKGSHRWREASGVRDKNWKSEPHLERAVRTNPDVTTGLVFFIPDQFLRATWISSQTTIQKVKSPVVQSATDCTNFWTTGGTFLLNWLDANSQDTACLDITRHTQNLHVDSMDAAAGVVS